MGRKKIQKAPKTPKSEEPEDHESEVEKSPEPEPEAPKPRGRGKAKKEPTSGKLNLFSDNFNSKVDRFKQFYQDFLSVRGGGDSTDAIEELSQVNKRVANKLEDACSDVLREDLQDAEKWIAEQQTHLFEQINSTQKAIEATRVALAAAGTFTNDEIEKQVAGIIAKEENLKKKLEDFENLKNKAIEIYKTAGERMDEE